MDDSGGNFSIQYSYNIDPIPNRCEAAEFLRYKTRNVHVYLNRWQHCNGFGWRWLLRTDCLNFLTNELPLLMEDVSRGMWCRIFFQHDVTLLHFSN